VLILCVFVFYFVHVLLVDILCPFCAVFVPFCAEFLPFSPTKNICAALFRAFLMPFFLCRVCACFVPSLVNLFSMIFMKFIYFCAISVLFGLKILELYPIFTEILWVVCARPCAYSVFFHQWTTTQLLSVCLLMMCRCFSNRQQFS
jgi:hypothetical protein